jgi:hypothetical protein
MTVDIHDIETRRWAAADTPLGVKVSRITADDL